MRGRRLGTFLALLLISAAASVPPATPARAATPACATSSLVVWLNTAGDGAAGSVFYHLEFTSLSAHACELRGYPGVSAVTLRGAQIGRAASRRPGTVKPFHLAPGDTAAAVLRVVQAENFPVSRCGLVAGAGFRVYPPGSRSSRIIPFPVHACSRTGVTVLEVGPVGG